MLALAQVLWGLSAGAVSARSAAPMDELSIQDVLAINHDGSPLLSDHASQKGGKIDLQVHRSAKTEARRDGFDRPRR